MAHAAAAHLEPRSRPPLTWRLSTALALAVIESFDDMGLKEDLLRGIYSYGFEVRATHKRTLAAAPLFAPGRMHSARVQPLTCCSLVRPAFAEAFGHPTACYQAADHDA